MDSEFYFNLKKAEISQTVKWEKHFIFKVAKIFKNVFFVLFILAVLLFLYGFLFRNFPQSLNRQLLGFSIIFLTLTTINWLKESFLNSKLKQPFPSFLIKEAMEDTKKYNLAELLSFETARAVSKSIQFAKSKGFSEVNSSILFYFLLIDNPKLNFIFSRSLLNLRDVKQVLKTHFKLIKGKDFSDNFSDSFQETILESLKVAQRKGHFKIEIGDVLVALSRCDLIFKKILIDSKLKIKDIENLTWWLEDLEGEINERRRFWEWKNLVKRGSLAKEWGAGFTVNLDKFSIDWSETVKREGFPKIIGHEKEIGIMERILSRTEINNVLIVGEPGSGRKSMVYALAERSVMGESLPDVNYKRVIKLNLSQMLAKTESVEEAESTLDIIFREAIFAGNVILVIDEFHDFVGRITRPGVIDISGILSSYLDLPQFQIVAITTFEGLHKNIEQNPSILSLFEKVEVGEIAPRETLMLLQKLALQLETKYKIFTSYPALRDIINHCDKYLPATPFPEKATDLLDEVMVYVAQAKEKIILPKHIAYIVSEKTQIPVGEIGMKEREILLNMEKLLHKRIINQEEAVKEVSAALRRARTEISIRKGPMGSFLFLGPTGVGKTETSKALAEIYFFSEERMIRLDMSEFQNVTDIPRLIGSSTQEGLLTTQVREDPFSLVLLDEIEKAHPNILNLFLQVLDEGHLTDGLGRKIDFKNTIIIATSNAAYQVILKALKENERMSEIKEKLLDFLFARGIFRPEFLNRFDAMVIFKSLTKENLFDIAELMLQKLKNNLSQKDIKFIITPQLKERIVELGYNPKFGAREMKRVIQDKIGNVLAQGLLSEELKRGNTVEVRADDFQLKINP